MGLVHVVLSPGPPDAGRELAGMPEWLDGASRRKRETDGRFWKSNDGEGDGNQTE